jgi:Predicted transcriptional regulators
MNNDTKESKKQIPMRELEKLTNLSRATINFYIREGLLPTPHKSAKNMAYYDETFIEKLKFIEKMRAADFTLNQIRKLANYDANTLNDFGMQIMEAVNQLLPSTQDEEAVSLPEIKELGFNDAQIKDLIELKIILPLDKKNTKFPAYSLTVCRFAKYFFDLNIPITAAKELLVKLHELADLEKNIFINYIREPMLEKNLPLEEQKKEVQRCIESIHALLPVLHLQLIKLPNETLQNFINEDKL